MRRFAVFAAALTLIISGLIWGPVSPANADDGVAPTHADPSIDYMQPIGKIAIKTTGPTRFPKTHDQFWVYAGISGASLTSGPHCPGEAPWICIDYKKSQNADTVVWSNNKTLTGTVTQLGPYGVRQGRRASDGYIYQSPCPSSIPVSELWTLSHNEYAARVVVTYTDGVFNVWTFQNEYYHLSSVLTGSKANGAQIGTQATHPIGGCKFYSNGVLATTGPHVHHRAWQPTTYSSSPIGFVWSWLSH